MSAISLDAVLSIEDFERLEDFRKVSSVTLENLERTVSVFGKDSAFTNYTRCKIFYKCNKYLKIQKVALVLRTDT